ncbi:lysozyme [Streptomyces sp. NK08204]|uniref:lysozyme n=1 Tax=Streptomyces sp. NK08204 TaxID=2873260 RepID=UPI001CED671A|nr:lysozyme [Streptomyces sp. NK08204]
MDSVRSDIHLTATGVLTGLLLSLSAPAARPASDPVPPVRGRAYMGIGVLAHDGRDSTDDETTADDGTRDDGTGDAAPDTRTGQTEGVDVSGHQRVVAWQTLWDNGTRWAYSKATEGTSYKNPYFARQYNGSYAMGIIHGAYHFATPDTSRGAAQADHFVDHGGGWSEDARTLPGALDIEWNPYGDACYGKSKSAMIRWIRAFLKRYKARTGRNAVIYTSTTWWTRCTGDYTGFGATNPLWIARYGPTPGPLPSGWSSYTMWQYTSSGKTVGDHDRFNGTPSALRDLATG